MQPRDFPGGPVVKNLPSNAGDAGSIHGQGTKIPHAAGQLSPHTTTTEPAPQLESLCVPNYRAHTLWSPHTTTTEPMCPGGHMPQPERENLHATTSKKPMRRNEEPTHHNKRSHMPQ